MASSSSAPPKKVTLTSSDGETFEVEEAVALQSITLRNIIEDSCVDNSIPVPKVTSEILTKVIEYCKRHAENPVDNDALKAFDAEFVKVDVPMLLELTLAANYLNIQSLFELMCDTIADMIKGKTTEQIRETFNIENDYTPDEEAEVRRENAWAFE